MLAKSAAVALALALVVPLSPQRASAGSWAPVVVRSPPPLTQPAVTVANADRGAPCKWTRLRGWHQSAWLVTWRACRPGPEWRYERRCWIGPGDVRHCRFYG